MSPDDDSAAKADTGLRGVTVVVGTIAAVVALAGALFAAFSTRQVSADAARVNAQKEVLGAAQKIALDFAAYDYRHLPEDFKRVADESTGTFHTQYLSGSTELASLIVKAKAVSTAEVVGAGVTHVGPRGATVVLALNRTITNTSATSGQHESFGIQMTLQRSGTRWLASQVTPL